MNVISLLPLISAVSIFFLTAFILFTGFKVKINLFFSFFTFLVMGWLMGSYFLLSSCATAGDTIFWDRLIYVFVVFIPSAVYHFSVVFTGRRDKNSYVILNYALSFIFLGLSRSDLFLDKLFVYKYGCHALAGPLHDFFIVFFGAALISMFVILYKFYYSTDDKTKKIQTLYIFIAFFILATIGSLAFLPAYKISVHPIVYFSGFVVATILAYAILKYKLFNIKVIATELLVYAIWIMIFVEVLLAETRQKQIMDLTLFVFVVVFGIFIIRSVIKEVNQRERFEKLNKELEIKTSYLTALQGFTADISRNLDFKTTIGKIVDEIPEKLGYIVAFLILILPDGKRVSLADISSNPATDIALKILPKPVTEYYASLETDKDNFSVQAILSDSVKTGDRLADFIVVPRDICDLIQEAIGFGSIAAVPVKTDEKAIGVIDILLNKPKEEISSDEIEIMKTLANQIGIVIKNASLFEQIKEANEKLKELDRLKSQFLSFASHQVKSPMTVVKDYATLIYDGTYGKVSPKIRETAKKIKNSADRMIVLVDDFLDLRKIEEGKMEYNFEEIDVKQFIKEIVDELKLLATEKKLKLTFEAKIKGVKIKTDKQKMRQVIQNLIDNAVKYTPKGFVKVVLDYGDDKKESVLIIVGDSGIGVSKELLPHLFEEFRRDPKAGKRIQGTGLGLYIAKQIVSAHHGEIWAESEGEDRGSRFCVRLGTLKRKD
ncbi:MAG: ATP-binding protein [Patescibacteria group bacterium]